mgnify:CR=1 FL=1
MSNYDRRDRQDETAMWDAGEVRRQESAQQQRRGGEKRRSARRRTGTAIYLVCVVLGSCLLAGIGWLMINDLCSLNKAPVEVDDRILSMLELAQQMYELTGGKINPLIGSAGVSAVPMAARVSQKEGQKANPANFLLMHAMGPNVAGVIGSAIAAGVLLSMFG